MHFKISLFFLTLIFSSISSAISLQEAAQLQQQVDSIQEGIETAQIQTTADIANINNQAQIDAATKYQADIVAEETLAKSLLAINDMATATKYSATNPSGSVLSNDTGATSAILLDPPISQYGALQFNSDGTYTYNLDHTFTAVKNLAVGSYTSDSFLYQIQVANPYQINYPAMLTQTATLTMNIVSIGQAPNSSNAPIFALDDEFSILKGSASVTGNVTTNDSGFLSAELTSNNQTSNYGALSFDSTGAFTYSLYPSSSSLLNLGINQQINEVYSYQIVNENGMTASASLTIHILGNKGASFAALDDAISINVSQLLPVTGNVGDNDFRGDVAMLTYALTSSPIGQYGQLQLQSNGDFSYTLDIQANVIQTLQTNGILTDSFTYSMRGSTGTTEVVDSATITVTILGDTGTSPINVEIENNDRSIRATALNSGQRIKGHLHSPYDIDWFQMDSQLGGNQIIELKLCPEGSTCYDYANQLSKKGWIMYVFDKYILDVINQQPINPTGLSFISPDTLPTDGKGEYQVSALFHYPENLAHDPATHAVRYLSSSNHMYLNYRNGAFTDPNDPSRDALVGIIDPCFDTNNNVNIGVPVLSSTTTKTYLIAISSALKGTDDADATQCGRGSVVLKRDGELYDSTGDQKPDAKTYDQGITSVFSDDQYTISVTKTSVSPLASPATRSSATYRVSENLKRSIAQAMIDIPEIRIANNLYSVSLDQIENEKLLLFKLTSINVLEKQLKTDVIQASYNPVNNRVRIPKLQVESNGNNYAVEFIYHPQQVNQEAYLELIGMTNLY